MKLKFATSNINKFNEVKEEFPQVEQLDVDFDEIQSLDPEKVILYKLKQAKKISNGDFIMIDDTSFIIDKIGLPGTLVKYFLEKIGPEGIYKFGLSFEALEATAINKIGLYDPNKDDFVFFEGKIHGKLVEQAGNSFGFDTIFMPDGYDKRFSEMLDMKKKIGHRALAIAKLKQYLEQNGFHF